MFRNFLFQIHWFLGITAGVVLAIVGLTGGMLAFEQEILRLMNRGVITVAPPSLPQLSPADMLARIATSSPGKRIASHVRETIAGGAPARADRDGAGRGPDAMGR